jgi:PmbA protein
MSLKKYTYDIIGRTMDEGGECEMFMESFISFSVEVSKGKIEVIESSSDSGTGVRYFRGGGVGYSYTTGFHPVKLREAFQAAKRNANSSSILEVDVLPGRADDQRGNTHIGKIPDGKYSEARIQDVIEMEKAAYDHNPYVVNTDGVIYGESRGVVAVANSRGYYKEETRGYCYCSIMVVAERDGETRSGWSYSQAQIPGIMDFRKVGCDGAKMAVEMLGSRQIDTGRYSVLFQGEAFTDIMGLLGEALSGENVVTGASFLTDRENISVASEHVTIIDNPLLEGGCFNAGFDAEGVGTRRKVLIDGGVLKEYLHHTYSAALYGRGLPGNAVRFSFRDIPAPGPTNLYLAGGNGTLGDLIRDMDNGILVRDIMGIHTADPVSGDFSLGIRGCLISGGNIISPFGEMTISGNLLELLKSVDKVGEELKFVGQYGSPDVIVRELSVSGN